MLWIPVTRMLQFWKSNDVDTIFLWLRLKMQVNYYWLNIHCISVRMKRNLSSNSHSSHLTRLFLRLDSMTALQLAKRNVAEHYTVVGVLERYREFLQVLEHYFPKLFKGIVELYDEARKLNTKVFTVDLLKVLYKLQSVSDENIILETLTSLKHSMYFKIIPSLR